MSESLADAVKEAEETAEMDAGGLLDFLEEMQENKKEDKDKEDKKDFTF